jgi:hypothetical protein
LLRGDTAARDRYCAAAKALQDAEIRKAETHPTISLVGKDGIYRPASG